jgi:hypothetical protein
VKASWSEDLKKAYHELEAMASLNGHAKGKRPNEKARKTRRTWIPKSRAPRRGVKEADDAAYKADLDAEETFDEAERRLDTGMAQDGAEKARCVGCRLLATWMPEIEISNHQTRSEVIHDPNRASG